MFNITVTEHDYKLLKARLNVPVTKDMEWHEYSEKYIDACIGTPEQRYSNKLVARVNKIIGV